MIRRRGNPRHDAQLDAIEFQVIGERKGDPGHLLLMCRDGQWYDYDLVHEVIAPIAPDDSWAVDVLDHASRRVALAPERIAS